MTPTSNKITCWQGQMYHPCLRNYQLLYNSRMGIAASDPYQYVRIVVEGGQRGRDK